MIDINDSNAIRKEIRRRIEIEKKRGNGGSISERRISQYEIMLDNFGEGELTDFINVCAHAFGMWEKLFNELGDLKFPKDKL